MSANLRNPKQWEPVDAPVQNKPGERDPATLRAVLAQFDVVNNPRYRRTPYSTFCNIFVWDASRALNAEIPHWIRDTNVPLGKRELNANGTMEWLQIVGGGWRKVDATEAETRADAGYPTVVVWQNPNLKKPGHIAMLLPSEGKGIRIAQAGSRNLFDVPLAQGFGTVQPLLFFTHE